MSTLLPPSTPFEIVATLGEGGSAVVYEAEREGQRVALKVLREGLSLSPRERARFLEEARLAARLSHPSLLSPSEAGELPDGRPFLAMPLVRGETLAEAVRRGPLSLAEALPLFEQLAGALSCVHQAGLVHRDVKPENVMLTEGGERAVLLDLGIAREAGAPASTTTREGVVRGTPAYMAPERFFGAQASVSSDIYELSVLLFVMLTAELPWADGEDPSSRLSPRSPSELGVALPGPLEAALLEALSTRPEARPKSVAELAERVREAAGSEPSPGARRRTEDLLVAPPPSAPPLVLAPEAPPPRPAHTPASLPPQLSPQLAPPRLAAWAAGTVAASALAAAAAVLALRATPVPRGITDSSLREPPLPPPSASTAAASLLGQGPAPSAPSAPSPQAPPQGEGAGGAQAASSSAPVKARPPAPLPGPPPAPAQASPAAPASMVQPAGPPSGGAPPSTWGTLKTSPGDSDEAAYLALPSCRALLAIYCAPELRARQGSGPSCGPYTQQIRAFAHNPGVTLQSASRICQSLLPSAREQYERIVGAPPR